MNKQIIKLLLATVLVPGFASAQESGFLDDYSILGNEGEWGKAKMYVSDTTIERVAQYDKIMIDQPWIYIDPESKSKGMKPDTMTSIAETLRSAVSGAISHSYQVVEEKGEGVLYFRWAITNMYLQKPSRKLLAYTPVGIVGHAAKGALTDFIDKNDLVDMRLEGELLDSVTGEVFVAMTVERGQRKDKSAKLKETPATWDELFAIGTALGERFVCRLDNTRVDAGKRKDCTEIHMGE